MDTLSTVTIDVNKIKKIVSETIFKSVTISRLTQDESKIPKTAKASTAFSYLIAYPEFIRFFKETKEITNHEMIIGINFCFGWMPTVFSFGTANFGDIVGILNKAKQGDQLDSTQIDTLRICFKNSLVGTSKLLHFINPDNFAIWDSKIYYYIFKKKPHNKEIQNCNLYLAYISYCKELTASSEYKNIHHSLQKKLGYPMTKLRTIELIMFLNSDGKKISIDKIYS